jgi:hypothetical protein
MKKPPDLKALDALLKGQIREPSPRFDEALRRIPASSGIQNKNRFVPSLARLSAIAAVLIIATMIGLNSLRETPKAAYAEVSIQELVDDPAMLTLFSLSEELELAASLLDEENQFALDYFSSAP